MSGASGASTEPAARGDDIADLLAFLDAAPSPFHAADEVARRLRAAGWTALDDRDPWDDVTGGRFVVHGGTIVAWHLPDRASLDRGFRIIGAHTDSPNLRLKPRPDTGRLGVRQLGVEVYGGALWNSWLDRDLGLSGRVAVRGEDEPHVSPLLVRVDRPIARIPQLAIHLDRAVNESGLQLNPQQHLAPIWGLGEPTEGAFRRFLATELGTDERRILSWELMLHDVSPARRLGARDELVSSARIDNLLSCWAATRALLDATASSPPGVPVICLFDHEEIGSESSTGAGSALLPTVLERVALAAGADRASYLRALAASHCASADGAHATNPNYAERHEPGHRIALDGGPVVKINAQVRYATDAVTNARFQLACERAGVPHQVFVVRTDLPCGSTIGPITAARLGVPTVDVGVAQLAMHAAREMCGAADAVRFPAALGAWLGLP